MFEFVETGIPDIDAEILGNKGLHRPGLVYILGHPGVGKTTFAITFLVNRGRKGEKGIYLSLLEDKSTIISRYSDFQFYDELKELASNGTMEFLEARPIYGYTSQSIRDMFLRLSQIVAQNNIRNIVVDSVTALTLYLDNKEVRTYITMLYDLTMKHKTITIMIGELPLFSPVTLPASEEFVADLVLLMDYVWVMPTIEMGPPRLAIRLVPIKSRIYDVPRIPYEVKVDQRYGIILINKLIEPYIPFKREVVPSSGH